MTLIYKHGLCTACARDRLIVKKLPRMHLCAECNNKRLSKGKPARKAFRPKPKKSGEMSSLFKKIWDSRPHVSEFSATPLGPDMKAIFFAHIYPRNVRPDLKFSEHNIVLLTEDEHYAYDFLPREKWPEGLHEFMEHQKAVLNGQKD